MTLLEILILAAAIIGGLGIAIVAGFWLNWMIPDRTTSFWPVAAVIAVASVGAVGLASLLAHLGGGA